jgi:hypothetical protein
MNQMNKGRGEGGCEATVGSPNYESLTVTELKRIAQDRSMMVAYKNKAELIARLRTWDEKNRVINERRRQMEEAEAADRLGRGGLRLQKDVLEHVDSLDYPFSFLRNGHYSRECDPIPGQDLEDIGAFPDNIAEYLWISPGANDECPWLCLCRLDTGVHVYFRGECDYTGFDCQGDMKLYAHRDPNILILMGMTAADYKEYVRDTVPIE